MNLVTFFKSLFTNADRVKSLNGLTGLDKADAILHNLAVTEAIPGLAITMLKKGETVWQSGYGYSDLENKVPMHPENSICRIASISKCITGLAFGKMVEQGILHWDDSFYKHVPYHPKKKYDFSLRQLASHTAGIRGYRGKEYALNKPFSIKESISVFQEEPLLFEPGKGYLYNSFDFVLLSLAMQEASGIPFEHYVQEEVLKPLGMLHTGIEGDFAVNSKVSCEYYTKTSLGYKGAVPVDNRYKLAGGGYVSTSADVAKLGQAILEGKLLQPKTYNELLTSQMVNGKPTYYGLGFQVSVDKNGRSFYGHLGNSVGAYSNFFVYPEEELIISLLINCSDPKVQNHLDDIAFLF